MPLRHNRNASLICRTAGVAGCEKLITSGNGKLLPDVTRGPSIPVSNHRTLVPVLKKYQKNGFKVISLELTPNSKKITNFSFPVDSIIVSGNESSGVPEEVLELSDYVVEIPVHGDPPCYNVAIATSIAIYEYMRQHK